MVSSIDEQLVLEVLRRVEIFARRLFTIAPALDAVVAGGHSAVLDFHVSRWMSKLAFRVRSRALVPLELTAHLQLEPPGVLAVEKVVHVDHCHYL